MEKVKVRIRLREQVADQLKATALFVENLNRSELADMILGEWLKENVRVAIGNETIKLGERPNLEMNGDDVRIIEVDLEGGESL